MSHWCVPTGSDTNPHRLTSPERQRLALRAPLLAAAAPESYLCPG